jgi:hypothetical protein
MVLVQQQLKLFPIALLFSGLADQGWSFEINETSSTGTHQSHRRSRKESPEGNRARILAMTHFPDFNPKDVAPGARPNPCHTVAIGKTTKWGF